VTECLLLANALALVRREHAVQQRDQLAAQLGGDHDLGFWAQKVPPCEIHAPPKLRTPQRELT
jgi:hypothetical protein